MKSSVIWGLGLALAVGLPLTVSSAALQYHDNFSFRASNSKTYSNISVPAACTVSSFVSVNGGYQGPNWVGGAVFARVSRTGTGVLYQIQAFTTSPSAGTQTASQTLTNQAAGTYQVQHWGGSAAGPASATTTISW